MELVLILQPWYLCNGRAACRCFVHAGHPHTCIRCLYIEKELFLSDSASSVRNLFALECLLANGSNPFAMKVNG
jgi:hypothetical protein